MSQAANCSAYRSRKLRDGLNAKTINNHVTVLSRILGEAVESGLIEFVPRVRRMKLTPPKDDFLTEEEATSLVEAAEGHWQVMILLALTTGLRQGELLGLQWRALQELLPKRGLWVFSDESGFALTDNKCKYPLEMAWRTAGLRRVGWHMLRHTFASHHQLRGGSLKELQEALGHSSINMVLRYAHLGREATNQSVQLLSRNSTSTAHERRASL